MMRGLELDKSNVPYINNYFYKNINKDIKNGKLKIQQDKIHRFYNWAKIDNKYYYIKHGRMLNEFIGEIIASKIGLQTANFEPYQE